MVKCFSRFVAALAVLSILLTVLLPSTAQCSEWQVSAPLSIPEYNYSFLAATPDGNLLAATFYSGGIDAAPAELPALLIRNPGAQNPEVLELTRYPFEGQRGYGGIACDQQGNFFLSGDTGNAETCFLLKFLPNGTPDRRFGQGGKVLTGERTLGMEILGIYILVSIGNGSVLIYDANQGQLLGQIPAGPDATFIRDIAIDPKSLRLFGVTQGSVVTWGSGAPWSPESYLFRRITPPRGELRSGEGISIDPLRRTVLITPIPGNIMYEIHGSGQTIPTAITTAEVEAHICDSVLSFDGKTLFVSDIRGRRIHVLRRETPISPGTSDGQTGANAVPNTEINQEGSAPQVNWHRSYTDVVRSARENNQPMVVYFGTQSIPRCVEVQKNVLLTDTFNQHAQNMICVYEDVSINRLIAYRFGAYRVPYIALLDSKGETVGEFVFDIDTDRLFETMKTLH